jgi:hypothetical protein
MSRLLTIHPPLAGIVQSRGFQKQPPYSCREALNFVPQYALDGSELLAIRPPMDSFVTAAGTVNLLCEVNGTISQSPQRSFVAAVNGQLYHYTGSALTAVGGAGTIPSGRAAFAAAFQTSVYIPAVTPLVYSYTSNLLFTWTATAGTVPSDARIIVPWAGGLWVAGQPSQPHVVSGCKTGDPNDWNFAGESPASAFTSIGSDAGAISGPITALVPVTGDSMIVSTPDNMQIWRGHPRRGGVADNLSSTLGIRGQGAWCAGPNGEIFMLTNKGFAVYANGTLSPISEERVPSELIGLNYSYFDPRVAMAYCPRFNAVYITNRETENPSAWWYDVKNGGMFKMKLRSNPYVMMRFDAGATGRTSPVLFGGEQYGGVGNFNLDGEEAIVGARVVVGPFKLSESPLKRSMISEANIVLGGGANVGDATVEFFTGPTGDSAYKASVNGRSSSMHKRTVAEVFKNRGRLRPKIADHAAVMVLDYFGGDINPQIPFEEATLALKPAGKSRSFVQHSDATGPFAGSFTPPPPVLPVSDLVAWYSFEESGLPFASGNGASPSITSTNGIVNKYTLPPIVSGEGVSLASSAGMSIWGDSATGLQFPNGVTIAGWINLTTENQGGFGFSLQTAARSFFVIRSALGTNLPFRVRLTGNSDILIDHDLFNDNGWRFFAASINPATNTIGVMSHVFYKSVAATPAAVSALCGAAAQTVRTQCVRQYDSLGSSHVPSFDEFSIWRRPLSAQEMLQLHALSANGYPY